MAPGRSRTTIRPCRSTWTAATRPPSTSSHSHTARRRQDAFRGHRREETPMEMIASISKGARWTGTAMSGLVILFLLFDGGIKLVPLEIVTETSAQIGLPTD